MLIPPELFIIEEPNNKALELYENIDFEDNEVNKIESDFHNIKVIENNVGRFVMFDTTYQAGFINTPSYKGNLPYINYFLLSYLFNPKIKNILLIGMGTGKVINDFEKLCPNIKNIDIVDIDPNIFDIACEYFNFKHSNKTNFHIQDGRIFLRETTKKYDLIILDIAGNEGIPYRYMTSEFLEEAKKKLSSSGIFISNMFSSAHFEHPKNNILKSFVKTHKSVFKNVSLFKADYGDKLFYESFFNYNERIIDITNALFFASEKNIFEDINVKAKKQKGIFEKISIQNIENYSKDLFQKDIEHQNAVILSDKFLTETTFDLENFNNYVKS